MAMITQEDIDRGLAVLKRFGASRVVLFGTANSDPEHANDLDLGCSGVSPKDFFRAVGTLLDEVGKPVDLIDLDRDNHISRHVEQFGKVIYAQ